MTKHLIILTIIVSSLNIYAQTAFIDEAKIIGSNFVFGNTDAQIKSYSIFGDTPEAQLFIINFEPQGWVIVSSNKRSRPVIGYSKDGCFDLSELNYNIEDWLNNQIGQIKNLDKNLNWQEEWQQLKEGSLPTLKSSSTLEPLLDTEWDQGAGWNDLCPSYSNGPNGKAYIGCVAVAMAQALYNIKYPDRPVNKKSYALAPYGTIFTDFDEEQPYKWNEMSLRTSDEYNRQLLYNCAVAVEMDFGGSGSGAYTTRVPFAFKRYFQMGEQVLCIERSEYNTEAKWISILKDELDKGNVLIYSGNPGTGAAGHAFNIDGYSANGYFHFNWGWSGKYNGNFSINAVAPGNNDFNSNQKAVIGIEKTYYGPTDIILSSLSVKANQPPGTIVGDISIIDNSEEDTFSFEVLGAEKFMEDGYYPAKFYVEDYKLKTEEVLSASQYPYSTTIVVTDAEKNTFEKEFKISVTDAASINETEKNNIVVFPNPAKDYIKINSINPRLLSVELIDMSGKTRTMPIQSGIIQTTNIKRGMYILKVAEFNQRTSYHRVLLN